ncbi:MAG TPA: class I SAM-dependent methyltransferase [Verrucomicrobiae bacterium]
MKKPSSATLRVHVTPTADWKLRSGHPWLFSDSIQKQNREGKAGEFAIIYDRHDNFLGIGLYDPASPLRVRLLHRGKPQVIDDQWWRMHLHEAVSRRNAWFGTDTTGYRCINGENERWPALVLDRYGSTYVLKLYSAIWFLHLQKIVDILRSELHPERLVLRLSRNIQDHARREHSLSDGDVLFGEPVREPVTFLENGLRLEADVIRGQKTGFFLDQRENRKFVGTLARGREVLNCFSFSGGFSLYAARGCASSVTDIDISEHALESSRRNFALNNETPEISQCQHEMIQANTFEWLAKNARKFDLIVLDPPSLAKREDERAGAIAAYEKLAGLGLEHLRPGGILVASSCSAHVNATEFFQAVRKAATECKLRFEELQTTGHEIDHPATFPEGSYLKTISLRLV